jgi:hypothetical protein
LIAGTVATADEELMDVRQPLAFVAMLAVTTVALVYFHDKFWWPPDDGAYAYVGARILAGDVMNRDVQDIHMGFINFANAFFLWLFGDRLVSLRYPLVAAGIVQACVLFFLFRPRGGFVAMAAAIALTALSSVQFLNPTAHWYCQFLIIAIIGCLAFMPRENWWRLFIVGLLLATLVLVRQLSGAIAAIGVAAFLLYEAPQGATGRDTIVSRVLMAIMFIGLTGYLLGKTDFTAFVLFGIWPLAVLARGVVKASTDNRYIARQLPPLLLGGAVAALPLLAYHILHGSLGTWYADTILSALRLTEMDFISRPRYLGYAVAGLLQAIRMESFDSVVNGVFWLSLVATTPVLGFLVVVDLLRRDGSGPAGHPLPFLAVFYALVSTHYQIPIYLYYTVGLSLAGLVWMLTAQATWRGGAIGAFVLSLSVVALYYQAAQPLSRGMAGIMTGTRTALVPGDGLDRLGLSVEAGDVAVYRRVVALVDREAGAGQTILAVPVNPEIYFLTGRRSPFRFFSSAFGIHDKAALADAIRTLRENPPRLVFHSPDDKYNTRFSAGLMDYVRQHYERLDDLGQFEVYRLR